MTVYNTASDWAADQNPGVPGAKLILMLLAFDIDKGEAGATHERLTQRAQMSDLHTSRALELLEELNLIEVVGTENGCVMFAPRWLA
jgi:hypothetical protein